MSRRGVISKPGAAFEALLSGSMDQIGVGVKLPSLCEDSTLENKRTKRRYQGAETPKTRDFLGMCEQVRERERAQAHACDWFGSFGLTVSVPLGVED